MPNKSKKQAEVKVGTKQLIVVDPSLPSFEDHPFFKKKTAQAKKVLNRIGLPKQLSRKAKSKA